MACLNNLEMSQWWPKDRVYELQNERLRALIKHAYDNVPYYRRIFDERGLKPNDIRCSTDLAKLPVLHKRTIRLYFDLVQTLNFSAGKLILVCTSGSTGEPLAFYSTKGDQYNWGYARALRARSWSGYEIGDRIAEFATQPTYETALGKFSNRTKRSFRRNMSFNPQIISDETMPLIARALEAFRPKFLSGYPSAIYLLAQYVQSQRISNHEVAAVLAGGEQLLDYQRELFHKVFNCETYSYYSSWEVHDIAAECAQHNGYHIAAENIVVEIADEAGSPVPIGVEGRILLTNLHNYAMPFIRYDIGDTGAISDIVCPCGRAGLPLLVNLSGRADAIIFTRSGKQIPGRSIPQRFLAKLGVEQYQIVQESYEEVIIAIVLDRKYPKEHKDRVIREIKACYEPILGTEITIKVHFTRQISSAKSGKREVLISKLSRKHQ